MRWLTGVRSCEVKPTSPVALLHVPKTAGTWLCKVLGLSHSHKPAFFRRKREPDWPLMWKMSVVRNPWDQAVSYYTFRAYLAERGITFRQWVLDGFPVENSWHFYHPLDQLGVLNDGADGEEVDWIGRYENLPEVLARAVARGCSIRPIPHHGASKREPYPAYYDDETIELVRARCQPVIERFGYEFDPGAGRVVSCLPAL